jgi:hypothetical protein
MPYVAVSHSPIHVRETSGPVDPGYGVGGEHPSHQPVPPSGPIDPGYGIELPPVASHPLPPTPEHPIAMPPTYPVDPDYGLPVPPTVWPRPPQPVDPSYGIPIPIAPTHPIYMPPVGPNNDLPLPPGSVWPPLPPSITGEIMCLVWIVGAGYRWTVIDTALQPEHPIAQPPLYPSHHPLPGGEHPSHQPVPGGPNQPPAPPRRG